jgi:hypothetical protein
MILFANCKRDGSILPIREWSIRYCQGNRELFSISGFGTPIARLLSGITVAGLCTTGELALLRDLPG